MIKIGLTGSLASGKTTASSTTTITLGGNNSNHNLNSNKKRGTRVFSKVF